MCFYGDDLTSGVNHGISDAVHAFRSNGSVIFRRGDIACGSLIAAGGGIGGDRLILGGNQRLADERRAGDLPFHIGKGERFPVFDGRGRHIGHIVAIQIADHLRLGGFAVFGGVAGRLCGKRGMIQRQLAGESVFFIGHTGRKLCEDLRKVIFGGIDCDGFRYSFAFQIRVFHLCGIGPGIKITVVGKVLFLQLIWVNLRGKRVGFYKPLLAVQVFRYQ